MILWALLAAGATLLALTYKPGAPRRQTTGKSGRTWFVEAIPIDNAFVARFAVYAEEHGGDAHLIYDQELKDNPSGKAGTRRVVFQAPSTLGATAKKDFVG